MKENRVVLYARVSTLDKQNPEMQLAELRDYAARRGLQVVGEHVDRCSGAKDKRPSLDKIMALARLRSIDGVIVWKLDRLGRSLRHLVNTLAEWDALGVTFTSLHDQVDLSTPQGKLMFQIIGAMAEFERSLIRERVRAGLQQARCKGTRLGRPTRVWLDKTEPQVRRLRSEGKSWQHVSQLTRIPVGTLHARFKDATA